MNIKTASGSPARIKTDALILGYCEDDQRPAGETAVIDEALDGAISKLIKQGDIKGKAGETTLIHTFGQLPAERVVVIGLGKQKAVTINKIAAAVATVCRYLRGKDITRIATVIPGGYLKHIDNITAAHAISEGAVLGLYTFRRYITRQTSKPAEVKSLTVIGKNKRAMTVAVEQGRIIAEAVNWARDLVNEPGNYMTPTRLAESAAQVADKYGLDIDVFDKEKMVELGMGGLLGVAQGSQQPPKFITITYKGKNTDTIDIALVGKGITFDSGGISIKPSAGMGDMKGDMAGAASVMATLMAVAQLKPKINVTAYVPATENMPSGSALKPGDIITAMNGKTMEIQNTDAEGRLVLADALCYAVKQGARRMIDVATLTGACQIALGVICTGAFSNNQALVNRLISASKAVGEYTWEMPMYPEYGEMIKGTITDIKNIGERGGGAITAAKFLEEFVSRKPWIHLDIAGTSDTDKDKGYLVKGATGVPVRTLVKMIQSMAK